MNFDERLRAVQVIQRFVRMSRALLPMFHDLTSKDQLDGSEEEKLEQIQYVYDNFHADPEISVQLINSNIVGLIQDTYNWLNGHRGESVMACQEYSEFIEESDRLINNWERARLN